MSTKTLEQEVKKLRQEVKILRSFMTSIISERDPEGEYKPEFVRSILKAMKSSATYTYKGKGSLLQQLKKLK